MSDELKCQAEDQGGWPCNGAPVVWRTKDDSSTTKLYGTMYFCVHCRLNKFIWTEEEAEQKLEPV